MINKVILIGRVGKEPEYTNTGSVELCKFSIATSESYKDKQGNKQELTEWHRIVIFGKQAQIADKYVSKGMLLYIEGKLKTTKYEKNGEDRYSTDIVANTFKMLERKQEGKPAEEMPFEKKEDNMPF